MRFSVMKKWHDRLIFHLDAEKKRIKDEEKRINRANK